MEKIINIIGWLGAGLMVGFSFSQYIPLAICGLICLTIQAVHQKMANLVGLNIASLIGFIINLLK